MINKDYIKKIIAAIDTVKSRTEGTEGNKSFRPSQADIDKYGLDNIIETVKYLMNNLQPGTVTIKWDKYSSHTDIDAFYVRKEAIEDLYALIGETSSRSILKNVRETIIRLMERSSVDWLKDGYYRDMLTKVDRGTLPKVDCDFDRILNMVCANTEPVYMRIFSVKSTGDSKKFEKEYKSPVCRIIAKYCPQDFEDCSDNDILRYFNILSYNTLCELKGPFTWALKGSEFLDFGSIFSSAGHYTGVIFNTDTLLDMSVIDFPGVRKIVTVENKANLYAAEYSDDTLYIYVHGFLSPLEAGICRQINEIAERHDIEIMHWGDLDYGGIKIYEFLKKNIFPSVKPFHMDEEAYLRYEQTSTGYPIKNTTLQKLTSVDVPDLNGLRDILLAKKVAYEQESIIIWEKEDLSIYV